MADIRINSLPSTATSFNTDDYIAIDGASGGTRKMLAANPPFTDVTFGTSGPSAKSSIAARAARQGLVFDGTAAATISIPAFGTSGFTQAFWLNQTQIRGSGQITYLTGSNGAAAPNVLLLDGTNELKVYNGTSVVSSGYIVPVGKPIFITVTGDGTTTKFYANGILVGSAADTFNYSGSLIALGSNGSTNSWLYGTISPLIYNRALSAAEVVALYEAGVPAGADYNSASNTSIVSGAWTAAGSGSVTSTAVDNLNATATGAFNILSGTSPFTVSKGQKIRLNGTFTSITGSPIVFLYAAGNVSATTPLTATGAELTATASASNVYVVFEWNGAGTAIGSSVSITRLGLLLAPDAGQAGGGLTWYDTSGNGANITLPASGVSWNVPTSGKMASALNITNTTDSTSISTGSLQTLGGLGVSKSLYAQSGVHVKSNAVSSGASEVILDIVSSNTGRIIVNGPDASTNGSFKIISQRSDSSNSINALAFDSSANATLAGNLTVSGTGNFGDSVTLNAFAATSGIRLTFGTNSGIVYTPSTADLKLGAGNRTADVTIDRTTGNATLAGNLTVSGTGTSSFAGPIGVNRGTSGTAALLQAGSLTAGGQVNLFIGKTDSTYNESTLIYHHVGDGSTSNYLGIGFYGADDQFNFKATGNLLLGTTTDSGNGKLQLASHTTSAGGIGFGTDTALYRTTDGRLALDHIGGNLPDLILRENGSTKLELYTLSGVGYLGTYTAKSLILQTNNTPALTLDSSQNATFAGAVTATGGIVGTTTNDNAGAGKVGEYVSSTVAYVSRVTITTDTSANLTSISLSAGDWDVTGVVQYEITGGGSTTYRIASISQTSATDSANAWELAQCSITSSSYESVVVPVVRVSLSSTTTIYCVAKATFASGTCKVYGGLRARRVR